MKKRILEDRIYTKPEYQHSYYTTIVHNLLQSPQRVHTSSTTTTQPDQNTREEAAVRDEGKTLSNLAMLEGTALTNITTTTGAGEEGPSRGRPGCSGFRLQVRASDVMA